MSSIFENWETSKGQYRLEKEANRRMMLGTLFISAMFVIAVIASVIK